MSLMCIEKFLYQKWYFGEEQDVTTTSSIFFQFNYHVINQQKLIKSDLFHSEINYWFEMFIFDKIIFSNKFDLFFFWTRTVFLYQVQYRLLS